METINRLEMLADTIRKMDFITAVRWIESANPQQPRQGSAIKIEHEALRLSQNVSLGFQGPALHALTPAGGKHAHRLHCNFQGLMGTNGALPLHYSEYADQRTRHKNDPTFQEFVDLFNHRLLSLLYRAEAHGDPAINLDRPSHDHYSEIVGALGGTMLDSANHRDSVPEHSKRWHAAWLGCKSKSPDGLQAIVANYFDVSVEVHEFEGGWLTLPDEALMTLGGDSNRHALGVATHIGRRVWGISHKFRLSIGPLSLPDYLSFKPGRARAKSLHDLVRNYLGDEWDWDLELIVDEGELAEFKLNRRHALGFDSWLTGSRAKRQPMQRVTVGNQYIRVANGLDFRREQ